MYFDFSSERMRVTMHRTSRRQTRKPHEGSAKGMKILIADDHRLLADALAELVKENEADAEVLHAGSLDDAMDKMDSDGAVEIGVAHGAAYGVYDPACQAFRDPDGCEDRGILWHTSTEDDSSSGTGSSVFDFNGDGRAEVIYNDQTHFRIYDGSTGDVLFARANSSRTLTRASGSLRT